MTEEECRRGIAAMREFLGEGSRLNSPALGQAYQPIGFRGDGIFDEFMALFPDVSVSAWTSTPANAQGEPLTLDSLNDATETLRSRLDRVKEKIKQQEEEGRPSETDPHAGLRPGDHISAHAHGNAARCTHLDNSGALPATVPGFAVNPTGGSLSEWLLAYKEREGAPPLGQAMGFRREIVKRYVHFCEGCPQVQISPERLWVCRCGSLNGSTMVLRDYR